MAILRLKGLIFYLGMVILCLTVSLAKGLASPLSERELMEVFLREFKARLNLKNEEVRLDKFRVEPREFELRAGQPYRFDWLTVPRAGSNTALLTYTGAKGTLQTLRLWGFFEVLKRVPVVAKPLQAGEVLREEDITLELRELSRLPHDVIFDVASALGKEVRVSLRPGMVLRTSHLQLPVLVKRNEEVEIFAQGRSFVVKAKGLALESGRLGEVIRVKNKESQRVVFAKVIGERLVEVSY